MLLLLAEFKGERRGAGRTCARCQQNGLNGETNLGLHAGGDGTTDNNILPDAPSQ
jgi:hypothetical protein